MTLGEFFSGCEESCQVLDILHATIYVLGSVEIRVTRSHAAFRRSKAFAWAWVPGIYLRGGQPPLVLTLSFAKPNASPRWKEVVNPALGRFTHHLELYSGSEIDSEVRSWLREAWEAAA